MYAKGVVSFKKSEGKSLVKLDKQSGQGRFVLRMRSTSFFDMDNSNIGYN